MRVTRCTKCNVFFDQEEDWKHEDLCFVCRGLTDCDFCDGIATMRVGIYNVCEMCVEEIGTAAQEMRI